MGSECAESHKLKLITKCFVKPISLANEASKKSYYLGSRDLFMLSMNKMQKGLLFNTKPHNLSSHFLPKLRKSLSISLMHFNPLAGRLATTKFYDEHACCFFVDCQGPGAQLIHASVEYTVSDIISFSDIHPIVDSFFDLGEKSINHDDHTRPLLSVQVTELVDGVFIGFTMNHCIADGTSLWHFVSTLSEIFSQLDDYDNENEEKCAEVSISRKPIFNIVFPDYESTPIFKLPYLESEEFIFRYDPGPLRVKIFHFTSKSISLLKAKANDECELDNVISSYQALCGFTWRSITRARKLQSNIVVNFVLPVNVRTRFDPPVPNEYFRCFLMGTPCVTNVGDLLSNKGLGRAAQLINTTITQDKHIVARTYFGYSEGRPFVCRPGPGSVNYKPHGVTVGGSPKFDMYGPEFGLGRAVKVLAGYANRDDGKVTANPGREGDGSVDLEICLKPEAMNALELDEEFMSFISTYC